jgi:hypothetical protein
MSKDTMSLWNKQQDLLSTYKILGPKCKKFWLNWLRGNIWIRIAAKVAPGNLVIRHRCLIDLLSNTPKHAAQIKQMILLCSRDGELWLEGANYWFEDTLSVLNVWMMQFPATSMQLGINKLVEQISNNFVASSYKAADGTWRAVPLGDTYDRAIPELNKPELHRITAELRLGNISSTVFESPNNTDYEILSSYLGINWHACGSRYVIILNGNIISINGREYKWYDGNKKKYVKKGKYSYWLELQDTFRWCRVKSALSLIFKGRP